MPLPTVLQHNNDVLSIQCIATSEFHCHLATNCFPRAGWHDSSLVYIRAPVAIQRHTYCWQGFLLDLAAVLAFLRRTLTCAAVVTVHFDAHLASIWRPIGAQKAPSWPKRRPRGPKMSPKGTQETPSWGQEAPKRPQVGPKRRPRVPQELPESSPRALGEHNGQFLKKLKKCRNVEQN